MAIIRNSSGQVASSPGLDGNSYDYVNAYAASRVSDPTLIAELVQTYVIISQSLGITPVQFIQQVQAQGSSQAQDIYLAGYLNSVRVRNALLGVGNGLGTPNFIQREIVA